MNTNQIFTIRIDWGDVDQFGHVNNLSILKYVQAARVNMLESLGMMPVHPENNKGPILASIGCQFKKPLFYPGEVTVVSHAHSLKNSSFTIEHKVFNGQGEVAAEAKDIIVYYDFSDSNKVTLPDSIRKTLLQA